MKTTFATDDGNWWTAAMSQADHDEIEAAFEKALTEWESQHEVIEVTVKLMKSELVDLIVDITEASDGCDYDGVVGRVLTLMGVALTDRYMDDDIAVDERANRAWHYWHENDDPPEWADDDDDDDVDFGEDDCS